MRVFGVHESSADSGSIERCVYAAVKRGCGAAQVFQKGQQQYWPTPSFRKTNAGVADAVKQTGLHLYIHSGYLLNLASLDSKQRAVSLASLVCEMDMADFLGARGVVLHPGTVGAKGDHQEGLYRVADQLATALDGRPFQSKLLVETMPGAGGQLCGDLSEMVWLIQTLHEALGTPDSVGVCFDTAHTHGAGYDFHSTKEKYERFWTRWDSMVGLRNTDLVHLNGARNRFAAHKDGHASLDGKWLPSGEQTDGIHINPAAVQAMATDPRFTNTDAILETPVFYWEQDLEFVRTAGERPPQPGWD